MDYYNKTVIVHYNLITKLRNELYTVYKLNYHDFAIIKELFYEEGGYILYRENGKGHVLGIIPKYTKSIYSDNEEFIIIDFTKKLNYYLRYYK